MGVLHKPVHPSVAYAYEDARELAEVFQNKRKGYAYGRQNNPTIEALAQKVTKLEQGLGYGHFWHWHGRHCFHSAGLAAPGRSYCFQRFPVRQHQFAVQYVPRSGHRSELRGCH